MKIEIPHLHTREKAKIKIENLIQTVKTEYGGQIKSMNENWSDYTDAIELSAIGYSISGTIEVKESLISIDLRIPFMLQPFSKKIRSVIEEHIKKALS
jgi:hypothetical protein